MVPYFLIFLFFLSIVMTLVFVAAAWFRSPRYLWAAAGTVYVLSFLGLWSIGLLTLVGTFIFVALAIACELGLKHTWQYVFVVLGAIAVWFLSIRFIDDRWLFFPFMLIEPLFS